VKKFLFLKPHLKSISTHLMTRDKIYFLSDVHLGFPDFEKSLIRERKLLSLLDSIKENASSVFLLGDVFEFWFEWKRCVPRGHTRFLAKLAELNDLGIKIYFFTGNHDIWIFDYLQQETGVEIVRKEMKITLGNKKFLLAHGDGLGPFDKKFKMMKKLFTNRFAQKCFSLVHPNFAIGLAHFFSNESRYALKDRTFKGNDNEWLVKYAKQVLLTEHFDYFIFGHRHLLLDIELTPESRYINLGDWISFFSYAVFEENQMVIKKWI